MSWASDPPGCLPMEAFLNKSNWEETLWQPQNTLEGLYIREHLRISQEEQKMWRAFLLTYQATVTVFFCLCPSLFLSISILCKHMDVLVSHPISRAHRQMLPLHLTFFSPILPGLECLLSASVYRVLLRLGRADVRLRPGASVLKSSKCFHVNSEFQHYPQSQLAGQWLRKGCTAKGRGPELKPDVSCDLSSHCVVANSPQPWCFHLQYPWGHRTAGYRASSYCPMWDLNFVYQWFHLLATQKRPV